MVMPYSKQVADLKTSIKQKTPARPEGGQELSPCLCRDIGGELHHLGSLISQMLLPCDNLSNSVGSASAHAITTKEMCSHRYRPTKSTVKKASRT